jgi:dienelactone hydrolase
MNRHWAWTRVVSIFWVLAGIVAAPAAHVMAAHAEEPVPAKQQAALPASGSLPTERVTIPLAAGPLAGGGAGPLTGYLLKPENGAKPAPAIVALHGCGGLFTKKGAQNARERDWAARWTGAGYVVLLPDSFGSRGFGPQCELRERQVTPGMRAADVRAAADWLAAQAFVDKTRLAMVGWSHGGATVLWAVHRDAKPAVAEFKAAIAFYPGCRLVAERPDWAPRLPLTILIGGADDWTPPLPCRALGERPGVGYVEYPGAYHGFDAPNSPIRVRTGLTYTSNGDGRAHVGTDAAARAQAIEAVTRTLAQAFK